MEAWARSLQRAEPVVDVVLAGLDRRIRELESAIGDLRMVKAQAEQKPVGRKTVPAAQVSLLARAHRRRAKWCFD